MQLQQLSVFLENRPGRLQAPLEAIAAADIDILTLSLADTAQFGILRLIVADWQRAKRILEEGGWIVNLTEVIAVDVEDRPGGLARVLKVLEGASLNIEYMYAFASHRPHKAILIFRFESPERAVQVLLDHGFDVVDGDQLLRDESAH
jgi:hypothetical protein